MEFSNTTTKIGIIQQIEKLTGLGDAGITGNALYLLQFTGDVNNAYSRVANIIIKADGRMQWDDANHGAQPVSNFNLVTDQEDYEIFTAAPAAIKDWLQVERIEILDTNGLGILLRPIDHQQINGAMSEYKKTAATPEEYDLNGTQLLLKPKPNFDKTAGGTIYFKRAPSYYASTATTKVPGFAVIFHELLVLWPSYWWGVAKGLGNVNQIRQEIQLLEKELATFYSRRNKYERPRITRRYQSFK